MEHKKDRREPPIDRTPSTAAVAGQPEDVFDIINKYGTYEIQPTAESENKFPAIAQGLAQKRKENAEPR